MSKCANSATVGNMNIDVILSFNSINQDGESQEWFNFDIEITDSCEEAVSFFNDYVFEIISEAISDLDRDPADLWKISTSSNWNLYKQITGKESLADLGHNCKWVFDEDLVDLDDWEIELRDRFGFGSNNVFV
jgi:hypothetical protein